MIVSQRTIGAVVLAGTAAFVALTAFCQMPGPLPEPRPKKDHVVAPPASDAKESGALENIVKLSKPADETQIAIAELLRKQPTPSVRATYFQSVLTNPKLPFKIWHLSIREVSIADGLTRVKVRAVPFLRTTARVHGFLDETYEVRGDQLKLIKTDPAVDPKVPKEFIITAMKRRNRDRRAYCA
jgi:hypothetical protein